MKSIKLYIWKCILNHNYAMVIIFFIRCFKESVIIKRIVVSLQLLKDSPEVVDKLMLLSALFFEATLGFAKLLIFEDKFWKRLLWVDTENHLVSTLCNNLFVDAWLFEILFFLCGIANISNSRSLNLLLTRSLKAMTMEEMTFNWYFDHLAIEGSRH